MLKTRATGPFDSTCAPPAYKIYFAETQSRMAQLRHVVLTSLAWIATLAHVVFPPSAEQLQAEPLRAPIRALVISVSDARFDATSAMLARCGFNVTRLWPFPATDPGMQDLVPDAQGVQALGHIQLLDPSHRALAVARTLSLQLTVRYAVSSMALDPSVGVDEYFVLFEDDAALDEHIEPAQVQEIVHTAARASQEAGVFFLGLGCQHCCLADFNLTDFSVTLPMSELSWTRSAVTYSRCVGLYTHAVGYYKSRALWVWEEMRARAMLSLRKPLISHGTDHLLFHGLSKLVPEHLWPVLAGASLRGHIANATICNPAGLDDGFGVFYQASATFPSQRLVRSAETLDHDVMEDAYTPPRTPQQTAGPIPALRRAIVLTDATANGTEQVALSLAGVETTRVLSVSADALLSRLVASVHPSTKYTWGAAHVPTELTRSLTHRLAWKHIMVDRTLGNNEYVLVFEAGVALPSSSAMPAFLATVHAAGEASQAAGIFWLNACGEAGSKADSAQTPQLHRSVVPCLRGYGIYKWRAAWLWDALQAKLASNATFHTRGAGTNTVSLEAHMRYGLPILLAEQSHWPAVAEAL